MKQLNSFNTFTRAYIVAALWTFDENTPSGEFETSGRVEELFPRLTAGSLARIEKECAEFREKNRRFWADRPDYSDDKAGHDFWLTRNHHGAGYWDRDENELPEACSSLLTEAAHVTGERNLIKYKGRIYYD